MREGAIALLKGKKVVSWVLVAIALAGIWGCTSDNAVSVKLNTSIKLNEEVLTPGIFKINLFQSMNGLDVEDICILDDNLFGVIASDPKQKLRFEELDEIDYLFAVFSTEDMHLLYQETITIPKTGYVSFRKKGDTTILDSSYPGNTIYYSISNNGITKISEEQYNEFYLSDSSSIIEDKNNLVLKQNDETKIILSGVLPSDNDAIAEETYRFYRRLSDTCFIYAKIIYFEKEIKFLSEYGIYDVETGDKTKFTHDHAESLWVYAYKDGKSILLPDHDFAYSSFGPYLYDDTTGELSDLGWVDLPFGNEIHPRFCLFGKTLVAYLGDQNSSVLRFFDLKTKTEIKAIDIPASYHVSGDYITNIHATEGDLWFYSCLHSDSHIFRLPIGEVKKK